jgi:hypothetical protein
MGRVVMIECELDLRGLLGDEGSSIFIVWLRGLTRHRPGEFSHVTKKDLFGLSKCIT